MKKLFLFAWLQSLLAFALLAKAEEPSAEFVGECELKADADYVSINISVHSDCHLNPKDAQKATDDVVAKMDSYLQKLKNDKDSFFKIVIDGGFTAPYSRYYENKNLCEKTFKKVTNITLNLANTQNFSQIFSDLQSFALGHFDRDNFLGQELARTYVNIGTPEPKLSSKHAKDLSLKALDCAFKDAVTNFKSVVSNCENLRWKVQNIKEQGDLTQPVVFRQAKYQALDSAMPENIAATRFDKLVVRKSLNVTFSFDGSLCYKP